MIPHGFTQWNIRSVSSVSDGLNPFHIVPIFNIYPYILDSYLYFGGSVLAANIVLSETVLVHSVFWLILADIHRKLVSYSAVKAL